MTAAESRAPEVTGDVLLAEATRRCDALRERLRARLEGGPADTPDDARAALRGEIAALIRAADAHTQAWRALADAARALPELWKQLPGADAPHATPGRRIAPIDSRDEHTGVASTRSDHLGASTFVAKGWTAYAAADFAAAETAFDRALTLAPDDAETVALLAWARAARGLDDDALLAAQRVLVASPRGPAASLARVAVGRVCLAKGTVGEAVEHLARVVRDNDDRRATLYATFYLGVAYQRREMYDDSVAFLRRALTLGPNLVEARYELGCTQWRAGARDEARAAWRAGAVATFSPWARHCAERLSEAERGETVGA